MATLKGHVGPVYRLAWSADSRLLLSGKSPTPREFGRLPCCKACCLSKRGWLFKDARTHFTSALSPPRREQRQHVEGMGRLFKKAQDGLAGPRRRSVLRRLGASRNSRCLWIERSFAENLDPLVRTRRFCCVRPFAYVGHSLHKQPKETQCLGNRHTRNLCSAASSWVLFRGVFPADRKWNTSCLLQKR